MSSQLGFKWELLPGVAISLSNLMVAILGLKPELADASGYMVVLWRDMTKFTGIRADYPRSGSSIFLVSLQRGPLRIYKAKEP